MKTDPKDLILEACLEEVLAGKTPPDLTDQVLQAWDRREAKRNGADDEAPFAQPTAAPYAVAPMAQIVPQRPSVRVVAKRRKAKRRQSVWMNVVVAAGILGIGMTVGLLALNKGDENPVAQDAEKKPDEAPRFVQDDAQPKDAGHPGIGVDTLVNKDQRQQDEQGHSFPEFSTLADSKQEPPKFERTRRELPEPSAFGDIVATINSKLQAKWDDLDVTPAPQVGGRQWCNRAYQRILGRPATDTELERFVQSDAPDKNQKLIDELVSGEGYADEYAEYWASVLTNSLMGPTGGLGKGDLASRDGLKHYLRDAIAQNKPYDQIAFELISATGSSRPGAEDFNGATNFLLAAMDDKATLATAQTCRVFLGQQIQCARCHDHTGDEQLTQEKFWELNAFFRQMEFERDPDSGNVRLVNVDFMGEGDAAEDAISYYETPEGELQPVGPAFRGEQSSRSGLLADVNRRAELAKHIVETDDFARVAVNRVWAHFLTYGLTRQVDDLSPGDSASHPELLDRLATEFAAHGYDMQDLVRWVAMSDAFALSKQEIGWGERDLPEIGEQPLFTRYYERPDPMPVPTALAAAAKAHTDGSMAARVDWAYAQVLGKKQDASPDPNLFVPVMPTVVSEQDRRFIHQIAASDKLSLDAKIQHLFEAAVARKPRKNELAEVKKLSATYENDTSGLLEVIWIVLTKSNEFVLER